MRDTPSSRPSTTSLPLEYRLAFTTRRLFFVSPFYFGALLFLLVMLAVLVPETAAHSSTRPFFSKVLAFFVIHFASAQLVMRVPGKDFGFKLAAWLFAILGHAGLLAYLLTLWHLGDFIPYLCAAELSLMLLFSAGLVSSLNVRNGTTYAPAITQRDPAVQQRRQAAWGSAVRRRLANRPAWSLPFGCFLYTYDAPGKAHPHYENVPISAEEWQAMQARSGLPPQKPGNRTPAAIALNRVNGCYLVEVEVQRHREEQFTRCLFVTPARWIVVGHSGPSSGKWRVDWTGWDGMQEAEVASMNAEVAEAFLVLYTLDINELVILVRNNPHYVMPKGDLIRLFNAAVDYWYSYQGLQDVQRQLAEVKQGRRPTPAPKPAATPRSQGIPEDLMRNISYMLVNPRHLDMLLDHLAEGGSEFSLETRELLVHLRKQRR